MQIVHITETLFSHTFINVLFFFILLFVHHYNSPFLLAYFYIFFVFLLSLCFINFLNLPVPLATEHTIYIVNIYIVSQVFYMILFNLFASWSSETGYCGTHDVESSIDSLNRNQEPSSEGAVRADVIPEETAENDGNSSLESSPPQPNPPTENALPVGPKRLVYLSFLSLLSFSFLFL